MDSTQRGEMVRLLGIVTAEAAKTAPDWVLISKTCEAVAALFNAAVPVQAA